MLLKKLMQHTSASPNILFRDPFKAIETEELFQEIIGLANLDFEGARFIVFGVNKASMQGNGVVGVDTEKLAELKRVHQMVAKLIEPALQLAFIYDEIDSKLVGALEIDGCDNRPYKVACDYSDTLTIGQAWTRDGMAFRAMGAKELDALRPDFGNPDEWKVSLGIGSDANTQHAELRVPDASNPPSERSEERKGLREIDWKEATVEAIGTINTNIARLMRTGKLRAPKLNDEDREALEFFQRDAEQRAAAADNHYYYEECAVRLQLVLRNEDVVTLQDLEISLGFPKVAGLKVVERVYPAPNGSTDPMDAACYPEVKDLVKGVMASMRLGNVEPETTCTIFSSPIRLAVGRELLGRKMAIDCRLRAANKNEIERIRLTVNFVGDAREAAAPDGSAKTVPA